MLLGYRIDPKQDLGELYMTNEGKNMLYWLKKIQDEALRESFAMAMIN